MTSAPNLCFRLTTNSPLLHGTVQNIPVIRFLPDCIVMFQCDTSVSCYGGFGWSASDQGSGALCFARLGSCCRDKAYRFS